MSWREKRLACVDYPDASTGVRQLGQYDTPRRALQSTEGTAPPPSSTRMRITSRLGETKPLARVDGPADGIEGHRAPTGPTHETRTSRNAPQSDLSPPFSLFPSTFGTDSIVFSHNSVGRGLVGHRPSCRDFRTTESVITFRVGPGWESPAWAM